MRSYIQSIKVEQVVPNHPAEQEGEESVHEMLLEGVFVLDHIVLNSQELEHVEVGHQGYCKNECDDSW